MINDLRDFIKAVQEIGECTVIENADWNLEIGSISEVVGATPDPPMLLFDSIKVILRAIGLSRFPLGQ
jgi:3-polyprenyl-4-hydroxybenzoate decarboxylase